MSTLIKKNGIWKNVNTEAHTGQIYTFNANLKARTTDSWFYDDTPIDISTLPKGVYLCFFKGGLSLTSQGYSNNITLHHPAFTLTSRTMSGGAGAAACQGPAIYKRDNTIHNSITIQVYNNANCEWIASSLSITFVRIG